MNIGASVVLYAVCWFMALFVILPLNLTTQEEDGEVVPGTPSSAPVNPNLKKKALWITVWGTVAWAIISAIIIYKLIPLEWFDFYPNTNVTN